MDRISRNRLSWAGLFGRIRKNVKLAPTKPKRGVSRFITIFEEASNILQRSALRGTQAKYNVIIFWLIFTRAIITVSLDTTSSKHKQKQKHMNSD